MASVNGSKPTLDMENLSWGDSEKMALLSVKAQQAQQTGDHDAMAEMFLEMRQMLSRVVEDMPRDWLVKSAPDDLDWNDPASFQWLKSSRMARLQELMAAPEGN